MASPPMSRTARYSLQRSSGFFPTAGKFGTGVPLSSMKDRYRSTHSFLSGSEPISYSRVIFSLVMVATLGFCRDTDSTFSFTHHGGGANMSELQRNL